MRRLCPRLGAPKYQVSADCTDLRRCCRGVKMRRLYSRLGAPKYQVSADCTDLRRCCRGVKMRRLCPRLGAPKYQVSADCTDLRRCCRGVKMRRLCPRLGAPKYQVSADCTDLRRCCRGVKMRRLYSRLGAPKLMSKPTMNSVAFNSLMSCASSWVVSAAVAFVSTTTESKHRKSARYLQARMRPLYRTRSSASRWNGMPRSANSTAKASW